MFTEFNLASLLPFIIHRTISPLLILNVVRIGKRTLFPNGYPGPAPIDPTPEEQAQILAKLLAWRGRGGAGQYSRRRNLPSSDNRTAHILPIFLGTDMKSTLHSAIEPLSSATCNVHLAMMLLDRIIVALFPELVGSAPS